MADIPPPPPNAPPPATPPGFPPPPPNYQQPGMQPPGSPGYMPPPIAPSGGINLRAQLGGAGYSIGVGVVGIIVPIISATVLGGNIVYFYALPIFGVVYGVRSIMRGFLVGGLVGIGLNIVAGIVSLTASGLLNQGS